jgi:23S rRNA (cytosine1962-C5)-methyltransferase
MIQPVLVLRSGREKSLVNRHPWIFSGAIERQSGSPQPGETVMLQSSTGEFLAWGAFSPVSKIIARIWSWKQEDRIDASFIKEKIGQATQLRHRLLLPEITNALRLVYAESDSLPGIIVDQYAEVLVVQLLSAGAEHWKKEIVDALVELTGIRDIYERSDVDVRRLEGLSENKGWLSFQTSPEKVEIVENGNRYLVDFKNGQKTGFFLDQRRNRVILKEYSNDARGLNCFCYTGGFTVNALQGGASEVFSIDSSSEALAQAKWNLGKNGFSDDKVHWLEGDVFQELRKFRDRNEHFDLIVLDPPKFAASISQVEKASRAYKDINLLAFKLLNLGGVLFTFSCSGGVSPELFQKIVAGAAVDASADVQIVQWLSQDVDHPVLLSFPESAYLKGLVCIKRG